MHADRVNYLNIGLMIIAAIAAFALPFEVFLFSYAVLGPLHYLTEISWLHEKGYFTRHKQDYLLLIALAIAVLAIALSAQAALKGMAPLVTSPALRTAFQGYATGVIFVAFSSALALAALHKPLHRAFALLFILVTAVFIRTIGSATILFAVFMPTLIHVFLFTGAFVLHGALKSRSRSGILSFAAFVLIPLGLYLCNDYGVGNTLNPRVLGTYGPFAQLNIQTIKLFHLGDVGSPQQIFLSGYGLLVMRFIAYAYTYHYLNWFSKTTIIRWHKVPGLRICVVILLWMASVGLSAYNYQVAAIALYCLSIVHVFLEFPLNHVTFMGIGREFRRIGNSGMAKRRRKGTSTGIHAGATADGQG